jgi:hypothetical protein
MLDLCVAIRDLTDELSSPKTGDKSFHPYRCDGIRCSRAIPLDVLHCGMPSHNDLLHSIANTLSYTEVRSKGATAAREWLATGKAQSYPQACFSYCRISAQASLLEGLQPIDEMRVGCEYYFETKALPNQGIGGFTSGNGTGDNRGASNGSLPLNTNTHASDLKITCLTVWEE